MGIKHRLITTDEFPTWRTLVRRAFNGHVHPEDTERLRDDRAELDRLFAAFDDEQIVGTGGTDSHLLTLPGGSKVRAAGIAYVCTIATHRRRGVLNGTMTALLEQAREREEPAAALWASESAIYSRFGFGMGTIAEDWEIDSAFSRFAHGPETPGRVRFKTHEEALQLMPGVWERAASGRPGFVDRSESRWRYFFFDDERVRGDWSGLFHVAYEEDGEVQGYAAYRLMQVNPDEDDVLKMDVVECVTVTDAAHAALWRFLFDVDLVRGVTAHSRPPDDPVWWMLADPRQLERKLADGLWVRLLDPAKALSARTYSATDRLVIEVADSFLPDAGGTFVLDGSTEGADCKRTAESPDITLGASELGAIYLGGVRLSDLSRSGRVQEHTGGALRRLDRMFPADQAPWCPHHF